MGGGEMTVIEFRYWVALSSCMHGGSKGML